MSYRNYIENAIKLLTINQFIFHLERGECIYLPLDNADSWIVQDKKNTNLVHFIGQKRFSGYDEYVGPKDGMMSFVEYLFSAHIPLYVIPDSQLILSKMNLFHRTISNVINFFHREKEEK